jgi:hypothetical protein
VIYESDASAAPDSQFAPGRLIDLVPGARARLLDPRRTPVTVVAVRIETGQFTVRVEAFEDAGTLWIVPLEDVARFQFALGGAKLDDDAPLRGAIARFDVPLVIDPTAAPHRASPPSLTLSRLLEEREAAREFVGPLPALDSYVAERMGEPALWRALDRFLDARGVLDVERAFAAQVVSNPWSGELVKGHAIVLAELGLCPFHGKVVRDPATFAGGFARARRAGHILARLAFVAELFGGPVTVFRGSREPETASFVSASLSRDVAAANVEGRAGQVLAWRTDRLFMTFMETAEMNRHFREAEALLLGHQTLSISAP